MNIVINGRFLTQRVTGVQRFAREISTELFNQSDRQDESALEVMMPSQQSIVDGTLVGANIRTVGRFNGHAWEQLELPSATEGRVLLNLCNSAPALLRRQFVVLHDASIAAMPNNYTFAYRTWYQVLINGYLKRARKLATVSKFSADEIAKYFPIKATDIEVIPESGEHILRASRDYSIMERLGLVEDGFFLAVSSYAPNKNFSAVIKAVGLLPEMPFKFVVVGGQNSAVFSADGSLIRDAVKAGYVSDGELRVLYEKAACFVYPSLYEGFGLPPLEAMTCGCPVIVSNAASLPEVCADAAIYCDPYDPSDIAKVISKVLNSMQLRAELREAGLSRAAEWTWSAAATRMKEVLSEVDV